MKFFFLIGTSALLSQFALGASTIHHQPGIYCYKAINPQNIAIDYDSRVFRDSFGKSAILKLVTAVATTSEGRHFYEHLDMKIRAAGLFSPKLTTEAFSSEVEKAPEKVVYYRECDGGDIQLTQTERGHIMAQTQRLQGSTLSSMGCSNAKLIFTKVIFQKIKCK